MMRTLGAGAFLALAAVMPAQQAAAQDPVAGAVVGGALGGIIGGAVGRGVGGVVAGAAIGAATGAIIASEAERRNGGYYWWHGGCYYRYPNGAWVQVEGTAEVLDLPDALEPLVEYFRCISGEHPDWDEYRNAMQRQGKCLIRMTIERWGPIATGGFPTGLNLG